MSEKHLAWQRRLKGGLIEFGDLKDADPEFAAEFSHGIRLNRRQASTIQTVSLTNDKTGTWEHRVSMNKNGDLSGWLSENGILCAARISRAPVDPLSEESRLKEERSGYNINNADDFKKLMPLHHRLKALENDPSYLSDIEFLFRSANELFLFRTFRL